MISYFDVLLHESDVKLLTGPRWINDQVIAFYFEYLAHEVASPEIHFLTGAVSFLLINGELQDLEASLIRPLKLKEKKYIFAAVNDNPDVNTAEGGSHWSLLVWDRESGEFLHLDSCGNANQSAAAILATKLHKLLEIEGSLKFATLPVPQQVNMYDCALYVLKFTALLATHVGEWTATNLEVLDAVTPANITEFRKELLQLIESKRS